MLVKASYQMLTALVGIAGKAGHIFQRLKTDKAYPDLMVILHLVHERSLGKVDPPP